MAKNGGDAKLSGPLYTQEGKTSLGGTPTGGPSGGKPVPDPLNFNKAGGGKK